MCENPGAMRPLRPFYRRLRHGFRPALRALRRRRDQTRIQRSVPLAREDWSDKRRRQHVLVDLVYEQLGGSGLRVVEVGTRTGRTARHLVRYCPQIERLFAVDLEAPPEDAFAALERVTFLEGWSDVRAKDFADGSLDLVFIDADHSEESVLRDLQAWLPKLRPGGILSGHDYGAPHHPGVKRAVDRAFAESAHPVHLDDNKVWWTRR